MYILQLLLHPIHIFYRIGILKLLLLALYAPIEFNEVVVAADRLHPRLEVGRPQQTFSLIKKRVDQSIYKTIGEFQRVGFVNNYGKNYIATHLIENAVAGMLYLLERSMILFVIGGDFRVILLDLVPDLQQLLVHVAFARLAKEEPVGESTWMNPNLLMRTDLIMQKLYLCLPHVINKL